MAIGVIGAATPCRPAPRAFLQVGRTGNTTPPAWPVTPENDTTPNRWRIDVTEITTTNPTTNIESVTFGTPTLNGPSTPLNSGDDVVIFGLSGSGDALVAGDTDGDGVVELDDDSIQSETTFARPSPCAPRATW